MINNAELKNPQSEDPRGSPAASFSYIISHIIMH